MPDPRLQATLRQWQDWPVSQKPELVRAFDSGLNHQAFLLEVDSQWLVLKLFSQVQKTETQGRAIQVQNWAAQCSLAPAILYSDQDKNYCLMEYCAGGQCDDIQALASKLKLLHSETAPVVDFSMQKLDLLSVQSAYLAEATSHIQKIHQQLLPAIQIFVDDSNHACVCHNDLVTENCRVMDNQAVFIDWEYAQLNNPWFDIASIFYYFNFDRQARLKFIQHYDKSFLEQLEKPICVAAICTVLWTDILWHLERGSEDEWHRQQQKIDVLRGYANQLGLAF